MSRSRLAETDPPKQTIRSIAKLTFKEFVTTWKAQGFESIELEFYQPVHEDKQLAYLTKLVQDRDLDGAVGYMARVLKSATVPGVVRYTLTGR